MNVQRLKTRIKSVKKNCPFFLGLFLVLSWSIAIFREIPWKCRAILSLILILARPPAMRGLISWNADRGTGEVRSMKRVGAGHEKMTHDPFGSDYFFFLPVFSLPGLTVALVDFLSAGSVVNAGLILLKIGYWPMEMILLFTQYRTCPGGILRKKITTIIGMNFIIMS